MNPPRHPDSAIGKLVSLVARIAHSWSATWANAAWKRFLMLIRHVSAAFNPAGAADKPRSAELWLPNPSCASMAATPTVAVRERKATFGRDRFDTKYAIFRPLRVSGRNLRRYLKRKPPANRCARRVAELAGLSIVGPAPGATQRMNNNWSTRRCALLRQ